MASTSAYTLNDDLEDEDDNFDGWSDDEEQAVPVVSLFDKTIRNSALDILKYDREKHGVDLLALQQALGTSFLHV